MGKKSLSCRLTLSVPLTTKKVDIRVPSVAGRNRPWCTKFRPSGAPLSSSVPKRMKLIFIKTDGANIKAMFEYSDILDLNRLYCNNVHSIYNQYGIEAASTVIVRVITIQ